MEYEENSVYEIESPGYGEQKPGTSGLRKKTRVFMQDLYLHHFIESIFSAPSLDFAGKTILVSGDGRYFNKEAIHIICEIAAAHRVSRVIIGEGGLISTPAASALIRDTHTHIYAAILLTASHNPGGIDEDFGVKLNDQTGGPAQEKVTSEIAKRSTEVTAIRFLSLPEIDFNKKQTNTYLSGKLTIEIIDPVTHWLSLMQSIFDFELIKALTQRKDFKMVFDGLSGVVGPYAKRVFGEIFKIPSSCLYGCDPSVDFNGGHPDPNLVYAKNLVEVMKVKKTSEVNSSTPNFGAAVDGDADRNMILGEGFFVNPCDSVAIIAAHIQACVPYYNKLFGFARSMPTSRALDKVAEKLGLNLYETPVGWKFFVNLMDAEKVTICGEESFGTSSNHIREKDGMWAILVWMSILSFVNKNEENFISVKQITQKHWQTYGRNYYLRHDYENVRSSDADNMMNHLRTYIGSKEFGINEEFGSFLSKNKISFFDEFQYFDEIDKTWTKKQGLRLVFTTGHRVIWRISGTGSEGATIRIYYEYYENNVDFMNKTNEEAVQCLVEIANFLSKIHHFTGLNSPTVIT